jgi:hydrogenase expression/formation protein HypE
LLRQEEVQMYLGTPGQIVDERITLSHGAGGRASHELVEGIFLRELRNPMLEPLGDSALLAAGRRQLAFTTDSCVVRPLFFAGGDIGELAVNGTINDLAMTGARPVALSAGFIVEEGLPVTDLKRVAASMACASLRAGVPIATGDTKVVEQGKADGLFINTSGVGCVEHGLELSPTAIRPGDRLIVSGPIGDHGVAVMAARDELKLEGQVRSDTAPLHGLVAKLLSATEGIRCLRDPTRGGLATVLSELAGGAEVGIAINEPAIPIRPAVVSACRTLGIDPLYVANEGRLIAIVAPEAADTALAALRAHQLGREAVVIGEVTAEASRQVTLRSDSGRSRVIEMVPGDSLPRIC